MKQRGFTLIEGLIALAMLSILATVVMTAFTTQASANTRSEARIAAARAAEQVLEFLRMDDPETMPTSGTVGPQLVDTNQRQYEVFTTYCTRSEYCTDVARHILVEVYLGSNRIYDVETVFTQVQ